MYWILILQILSHSILTILLLRISGEIGKLSLSLGYSSISNLSINKNLSFNIFYRILYLPIALSFISIFYYLIKFDFLITNIWLISIWYFLLQFLFSINKLSFTHKGLYFGSTLVSIVFSYFIYIYAIRKGLSSLLPDPSNFRTELWFIVILFFYGLFNSYELERDNDSWKAKLGQKYLFFKKKYNHLLIGEFKDIKILNDLLFSIMIFEDMNRPKWVRFIENIMFRFGLSKTTGIMQVKSNSVLNDEESINEGKKIILSVYNKYKHLDEYDLLTQVFTDYNPDAYYRNEVRNIYFELKEVSGLLDQLRFMKII